MANIQMTLQEAGKNNETSYQRRSVRVKKAWIENDISTNFINAEEQRQVYIGYSYFWSVTNFALLEKQGDQ